MRLSRSLLAILVGTLAFTLAVGLSASAATPSFVGVYDTAGNAYGVAVSGDIAYVADASSGLHVIDVSEPGTPTLLGTYNTPGAACDVAVVGDIAYVADAGSGLQVIDVSEPGTPTLLGVCDTGGSAQDVAVVGDMAYVSNNNSGLQVIDVSEPGTPTLVSTLGMPSPAEDIAVVGDVAYVADNLSGLQLIDVSEPGTPTPLGAYNTPHYAFGVAVAGDVAYVADYASGLQVIDVSEPGTPTPLGTYNTSGYAFNVAVAGDVAYVADYASGLQVIDVSEPGTPTLLGTYDTPVQALGVAVAGHVAYVADDTSGLRIFGFVPRISGTVRSSWMSVPAGGAVVELWESDATTWSVAATVSPDASGGWTYSTEPTVATRVRIVDPSGAHAPSWYGGTDVDSADDVFADAFDPPSITTTLTLLAPGSIAGTVRSADDSATLQAIEVSLRVPALGMSLIATTVTDAGGAYSFAGLAPSQYVLGFSDPAGKYAAEYHQDAAGPETATPVAVARDETVTVDAGLGYRPFFRGTVYDDVTLLPMQGVRVQLYDAGPTWAGTPTLLAETTTSADGSWACWDLADRPHIVAFVDPTSTYRDMTYPGRGLPLDWSWAYDPTPTGGPLDAYMVPLATLQATRVERVSGSSRYGTALSISRANFASADTAIIASGRSYPDALAAASLAGVWDAPILLTTPDSLSAGVAVELKRLGVSRIYIVGGAASVSSGVVKDITDAGLPVPIRLAGRDRYQTAAIIADTVVSLTGGGLEPFVCRGDAFPDALAVSPFAFMERRPILLVRPDSLPEPTRASWQRMAAACDDTIIAVGGEASVGDGVLDGLAASSSSGDLWYYRLAGSSRYETCRAVVEAYGMPCDVFGVASGQTFPDALAGGPACGRMGAPVLLTRPEGLSAPAGAVLGDNARYAVMVQCFGGTAALSDTVMADIRFALGNQHHDIDSPTGYVTAPGLVAPTRSTEGVAALAAPQPDAQPLNVSDRDTTPTLDVGSHAVCWDAD